MRLSRPSRLSLFLPCALAAVLLLRQAPAAALVADARPSCSGASGHDFPLTTRIHGGPGSYKPGGADHTWFIDLNNPTEQSCENIHPVVVLADRQRMLRDAETKLEFFWDGRWRPVTFTHTDRQELAGPFDDGFPGFTVAPHRKVTVKVRLAVTAKARPNDVMLKAAIVRKDGNDGDWVGESNGYWFQIESGPSPAAGHTDKAAEPDKAAEESGKGQSARPAGDDQSAKPASKDQSAKPAAKVQSARPAGRDRSAEPAHKSAAAKPPAPELTPTAQTLAVSTPQPPRDLIKFVSGLMMAAAGLLVAGGSLVMARRRQ
ncbi:hypothetical protein ABZ876_22380 [Streptomyces sp. NPDC046931]|uniref:hypothetical protein n=1 Tax=Streptomyces sp. NPDC046931 TaxID=3154806 RepID=UPI0033EAD329